MDRESNLAIFADYENVAIGVADAKYKSFDIPLVLARLLDKGKIVVKKAYADWGRYSKVRRSLHEAAFELIEIPHVSYSGKNSADIRLVVDALDMCYTKPHVDTFVIISGDSDFSPLVSKLRENAKRVIGLGVKNSTSSLLVENCDEFIYYDDLVREREEAAKQSKRRRAAATKKAGEGPEDRREEAFDLVLETVEALMREGYDPIWGSMVKQTLKRKQPHFSERFHGFRSFNELLEAAAEEELLHITKDERSGGYKVASLGPKA